MKIVENNIMGTLPHSIDYHTRMAIGLAYKRGVAEGYAERQKSEKYRLSEGTRATIKRNIEHFNIAIERLARLGK